MIKRWDIVQSATLLAGVLGVCVGWFIRDSQIIDRSLLTTLIFWGFMVVCMLTIRSMLKNARALIEFEMKNRETAAAWDEYHRLRGEQ
jgi:hypothetical protein